MVLARYAYISSCFLLHKLTTLARVSTFRPCHPIPRHSDLHSHIWYDGAESSRLELGRYCCDAQLRVLWLCWHCGVKFRLLHGCVRYTITPNASSSLTLTLQISATSRCMSRTHLLTTRLYWLRHLVWHNLIRGHSRLRAFFQHMRRNRGCTYGFGLACISRWQAHP